MIISLMIAMMKHFQQIQSVTVDLDTTNLFILIAIVFVFVIVSPEEYQRIEFHVFEEILEGMTFTSSLHWKKQTEAFPNASFYK